MTKPASFAISSLTLECVRSASFAALLAASAIAASTQSASAANITYFVDHTIPGATATGSVTGSITIDGTFLGPQFTSDIVGFDLTISVNGQTSTLMDGVNGGSVFLGSGALTATPTELGYNFGTSGGFANFVTSPGTATACAPAWTLRAAGGDLCGIVSGTVDAALAVNGGPIASVPGSGIVTIAVFASGGLLGWWRKRPRVA